MTDAKKTPKNIVNKHFVQVKGPAILNVPDQHGDVMPVIMDRHWMEPLSNLAKECDCKIKRWIALENDSDILLEFDTSQDALIFALKYER
jgi:hypothetical protein|tara:strand:+ start:287 stop:556 length:270 start_codon:yes stop_codon:yes gene_type:complete